MGPVGQHNTRRTGNRRLSAAGGCGGRAGPGGAKLFALLRTSIQHHHAPAAASCITHPGGRASIDRPTAPDQGGRGDARWAVRKKGREGGHGWRSPAMVPDVLVIGMALASTLTFARTHALPPTWDPAGDLHGGGGGGIALVGPFQFCGGKPRAFVVVVVEEDEGAEGRPRRPRSSAHSMHRQRERESLHALAL